MFHWKRLYIETPAGKKYNRTHGVLEGATSYVKSSFTRDYSKQAMDYRAQLLPTRFDGNGRTATAAGQQLW